MKIISTLAHLGRHYMARHVKCRFSFIPLGEGSDNIGYVEECVFQRGFLTLRGWTLAHSLLVELGGVRHQLPRRIQRGDVVVALGARMISTDNQHGRVGFNITVPWFGDSVQIIAEDLPESKAWPLPLPSEGMLRSERRQTMVAFGRDLIRATPTALRYFLRGRKPEHRYRLRQLLNLLSEPETGSLLNPSFLNSPEAWDESYPATTIIMPVYNAFDVMTEALDRVDRNTDVRWHLILIDDASPDPRVRPWLTEWVSRRSDQATLLVNEHNLGFVGSVNRGLALAAQCGGPVILLNSDALVPEGWASRLLRPIMESDNVASVTPMSNDATILSVPWIAGRVTLDPGTADHIDAAARKLSSQAQAEIPTGVGFCMAMSRAALDALPEFDHAFGRGYGEEVDWCRKTKSRGMVHIGIGNLFVEHKGGQSFGDENKATGIEDAARLIRSRYPEFDEEVQRFIATDPLLTARLHLALARAAAMDPSPLHIYMGHSLGGGAEHWLSARIEERTKHNRRTAVIRVGGNRRFRVELHAEGGILTGECDSPDFLLNLLLRIPYRHIFYSCGVGDERPWELPGLLCELSREEGSTLEIFFHDYFPISPSLNLLNADGNYTGVPSTDSTDPAHHLSIDGIHVPLRTWRECWSRAVDQADRLTVFSVSSAEIVEAVWPRAKSRINCQPHQVLVEVPELLPESKEHGVIGVLGAIGQPKGAELVSKLAYHLDRLPHAPRLTVVGEFDHSFPLPASVKVTGKYDQTNLPHILSSYGVTAWLMPSIWPETFSFTTHEMLATGLPVMALDIGAQGEAVRKAKNGYIIAAEPEAIYECYQNLCCKR